MGAAGSRARAGGLGGRRWPYRLLVGVNVLLAVCILTAGGGYAYLRWRLDQIHRLHIGAGPDGQSGLDTARSGAAFNLLLVGSDTRQLSPQDQAKYGGVVGPTGTAGARSDTIMILHVDPGARTAAVLSVPRDTWVPIDGGAKARINSAFDDAPDGPARLIRTIRNVFGIPINHYASVNFPGFRDLVNAIGGVTIYFAAPARDTHSGLNVPSPGCVHLNGDQALAYVRSRYYEYYESGRWRPDPDSDLSRIKRQQDFIRRVLRKATSSGTLTNPAAFNGLIAAVVSSITVDDQLTTSDMRTLASRFRSITPDKVTTMTVPTLPTVIGGADVLLVDRPATNTVLAAFGAGPLPGTLPTTASGNGPEPATISVRIQNGTGMDGQASRAGLELTAAGFGVVSIGDATTFAYAHTAIRYGRNQAGKAKTLQAALAGPAILVSDPALTGADVELIVGRDYQGPRPSPAATGTSTSSPTSAPAADPPPTTVPPKGTDPSVAC